MESVNQEALSQTKKDSGTILKEGTNSYLNCTELLKELSDFDENLSYEDGYQGNLYLMYKLVSNQVFHSDLKEYVKLSGDFLDCLCNANRVNEHTALIQIVVPIHTYTSDSFWGLILNGGITLKKGFASSDDKEAEEVSINAEVLLHDQKGGFADIVSKVSGFATKYSSVISGVGTAVSVVSGIFDIGVKFAELVGWKESTESILKDIRGEIQELKTICCEVLDVSYEIIDEVKKLSRQVEDISAKLEFEQFQRVKDRFGDYVVQDMSELNNFNNLCDDFDRYLRDALKAEFLNLGRFNSNDVNDAFSDTNILESEILSKLQIEFDSTEFQTMFRNALITTARAYQGTHINGNTLYLSYQSLLNKIYNINIGREKLLENCDGYINTLYNWDEEANPYREAFRYYVGNIILRTYVMMKAIYSIDDNNKTNSKALDESYAKATQYINDHPSKVKIHKDTEAKYNLVFNSFVKVKEIKDDFDCERGYEKNYVGSKAQFAQLLMRKFIVDDVPNKEDIFYNKQIAINNMIRIFNKNAAEKKELREVRMECGLQTLSLEMKKMFPHLNLKEDSDIVLAYRLVHTFEGEKSTENFHFKECIDGLCSSVSQEKLLDNSIVSEWRCTRKGSNSSYDKFVTSCYYFERVN